MSDQAIKVIQAMPGNNKRCDPSNMWGKTGTLPFPCDRCGKSIRWGRVLSNGHVRAACETEDCFQIMS